YNWNHANGIGIHIRPIGAGAGAGGLPRIRRVAADGLGGEYATIQAAINAAADGDEIVLAPGVYTGWGNRDLDLWGKAIVVRSEDPSSPAVVAATVIDCQGTASTPHRG